MIINDDYTHLQHDFTQISSAKVTNGINYNSLNNKNNVTHLKPMFNFCTPWKDQKIRFSEVERGIEMEQYPAMGWNNAET